VHGGWVNCRYCLWWYVAAVQAYYASCFISPWSTGETAARRAAADAQQALAELRAAINNQI
jgi:glucose-6-phosphate isomerase